jgi:hypothetical protein
MPLLTVLTSHNFSNIATLGIFSPLPQPLLAPNQFVDPCVLHEIDRIEQRNIHDWSEKFPLPNFMLKTASLQKVKKSRKFHYI